MSYRQLTVEDAERIDHQLDDMKAKLVALHTLTTRLSPDDDECFRSAEALWHFAESVSLDVTVGLDGISRSIGGTALGIFDPDPSALDRAAQAAKA